MPNFSIEVRVKSTGFKGVVATSQFQSLAEAKDKLDTRLKSAPPKGTSWDDLEILEVFFDDKLFAQDVLMAMAVNEFILGKEAAAPINANYLEWFKTNAPSSCLTHALKHTKSITGLVTFCELVRWEM